MQASNELQVEVSAVAGSNVEVSIVPDPDPTFTMWGPQTEIRYKGQSDWNSWTSDLPDGTVAPFALHLLKAQPDGTNRAMSATVVVNGVEVIGTG